MTGKNQQALDWLERHVIMPHEIKQTVYAALKQPEVDVEAIKRRIAEKVETWGSQLCKDYDGQVCAAKVVDWLHEQGFFTATNGGRDAG